MLHLYYFCQSFKKFKYCFLNLSIFVTIYYFFVLLFYGSEHGKIEIYLKLNFLGNLKQKCCRQFCLGSCPRLFAHIIILDLERQHCQDHFIST